MKKKKILLCDDHPAILEVTEEILLDNGFDVITCASGESVSKELEQNRPDLLMIDLRMPKKSGDEITKSLRQNDQYNDLPIIIFSANHKWKSQAMEAGADEFICKPFEIDELLNAIDKSIQKHAE